MTSRIGRAERMAPEQRRAAIVSAALPLVLEHGPDVTTRQLAEAAGVAEGTLFRVFPDKEALVWAVVGAAADPRLAIEEMSRIERGLPLRTKLEACVEIMQARLLGVFTLFDALRMNGPPPHHVSHTEINNAFRDAMARLVEPDAHLLRVPPVELVHVMRLLTFSATHPRIAEGHPMTARQIVSVLLDGLCDRPELPPIED